MSEVHAPTYVVGPGVKAAMEAAGDEPRGHESFGGEWIDADGTRAASYSLTHGRDALYRWTAQENVTKRLPFESAPTAAPHAWPPQRTGRVVRGIDVSSHDGLDIGAKIARFRAQHVAIHAYTKYESAGLERYTQAQSATATALGCTKSPYMWFFGNSGADGARDQVNSCLERCVQADIPVGSGVGKVPLAFDLETYKDQTTFDPGPIDPKTLDAGLDECDKLGIPVVFYTGFWWVRDWFALHLYDDPATRIQMFARYANRTALWLASYDGIADLGAWAPFANFTLLHGKQYRVDSTAGVQTDIDVFDTSITGEAA